MKSRKPLHLVILGTLLFGAATAQKAPGTQQAQDDIGRYFTGGAINGTLWLNAGSNSKIMYYMGFREAIQQETCGDRLKQFDQFISSAADPGQFIEAVDRFYANPSNRAIPVSLAFVVVSAQTRGVDPPFTIEEMRKYSQDLAGSSAKKGAK